MGDMVLFDLDEAPRLLGRLRTAAADVEGHAAVCRSLYLRACKSDHASPRLAAAAEWLRGAADDLDWRLDLVRSSQAIPLIGGLLTFEVDGMVGMWFTHPDRQSADAAADGRALVERVDALLADGKVEEAMEALAELQRRESDRWFVAGFAQALGPDGVEGLQRRFEEAEPPDRGGWRGVLDDVTGAAGDFFGGAWEATWGTVKTVHGLTTQVVVDPGGWAGNWGDLGSGLWHGVQNPDDFALAIINWEGLKENPARWAGSLVPDAAAAFFSGGSVTAARRGTSAAAATTRLADTAGDVGDAARAADRLDGVRAAIPAAPNAYSVAFEVELPTAALGRSRSVHFNRANARLDEALRGDPDFADAMEGLIPGVRSDVGAAGGRQTPSDWTWHHAPSVATQGRIGVMQLVPRSQHAPGSLWQALLHPDGAGGYAEWAVPRGAPPNRPPGGR